MALLIMVVTTELLSGFRKQELRGKKLAISWDLQIAFEIHHGSLLN